MTGYAVAQPNRVLFQISRLRERIQRHLVLDMQRAGLPELAPTHGEILVVLAQRGPVPMMELAAAIDRDKSTLTALVDKLVALGLARKTPDPEDRRVVRVEATARARALQPVMLSISRKLIRKAYRGFAPEERALLGELLDRLYANIGAP